MAMQGITGPYIGRARVTRAVIRVRTWRYMARPGVPRFVQEMGEGSGQID